MNVSRAGDLRPRHRFGCPGVPVRSRRSSHAHGGGARRCLEEDVRRLSARRAEQAAEAFLPFDPVADYAKYIDGKPRYDGVRSFLRARAISLPRVTRRWPERRDRRWPGRPEERNRPAHDRGGRCRAVPGLRPLYRSGAARGVTVRSRVIQRQRQGGLAAAGIEGLFEQVVDAQIGEQEDLRGKPAPDFFSSVRAGLASRLRRGPSSKMPWPASRPAAPAVSAAWSASIALDRRASCADTAPTLSCPIWGALAGP